MKKIQNQSVNLNNLDISRLSKGIHKYLKSKGCKDIKLGWINEGVAKSLGFNNLHDILKINEKTETINKKITNENNWLSIEKDVLKDIIDKCFKLLDVSEFCRSAIDFCFFLSDKSESYFLLKSNYENMFFQLINFIEETYPNNNIKSSNISIQKLIIGTQFLNNKSQIETLKYLLDKKAENIIKRFKSKKYKKINDEQLEIEFSQCLLSLINVYERKEHDHVRIALLQKIYTIGSQLEEKKYQNDNKQMEYHFINYDIASLILSEENVSNINLKTIMDEKIKYAPKTEVMENILDLTSSSKSPILNIKSITTPINPSFLSNEECQNYFIDKAKNAFSYSLENDLENQRSGKGLNDSMWFLRAKYLLNIIVKGLLLIKKDKKGLTKQDILNNLDIKKFEALFNHVNEKSISDKKCFAHANEMKELIYSIPCKNDKNIKKYGNFNNDPIFNEQYCHLVIIIKDILNDKINPNNSNYIDSDVFNII